MNKVNQASPAGKRILFIILGVFIAALLVLSGVLIFNNSSLQRQNGDLQASLDQTSAELDTLKQTAEPEADITALNEKYAALETAHTAYQADAQAAAEASAAANAALQSEFDAFKAQAEADLAAALAGSATVPGGATPGPAAGETEALSALQAEFDAYKATAQADRNTLQGDFDAYKATAIADLAAATLAQSTLQTELDTLKAAAGGETQLTGASDQTLSALQTEFASYKEAAQDQITTLQGELDTLKAAKPDDATALQSEFDAYKAEAAAALQALQAEFDTFKAGTPDITALQSEFDAYKVEAAAALQTIQAEFDAFKAGTPDSVALQSEFDAYKAEAAAALQALQAEFDAFKAEAETTLTASKADLETVRESGTLELQTLQTAFDAFKTEAQAAQADLQANFSAYQASAEAALTEAKQAEESAARLAAENAVPADINGAGNIANGNLAVLYEGNIYYHNNYQNGNIFMENMAGFGDTYVRRTSLDGPNYLGGIAAVENGSLYYINNDNLYRLNLASGDSEFMKSNMNLYAANGMHIYDDRIYFLKALPGADGQPAENLYLVDFRCNNLENVPGVSAYAFAGADKYLYYVDAKTWNLVKFDLVEKTGAVVLQSGGQEIANLNLVGDALYFTLGGQLTKANTDGTGLAPIGTAQASSLNVVGDWIYYSNTTDSEKLYRITTGGLYDQLVCDVENTCCISVAGGWVYFIQYAGQGDQWTVVDTYKVRLDGTDLTQSRP